MEVKWRFLNNLLGKKFRYRYLISSEGEVRRYLNYKDYKVVNWQITDRGYARIVLILANGKKKFFKVHRLVAIAFIVNLENKLEVNHKDGKKLNNRYTNLEWSTRLENITHAYSTGLLNNLGERHPKSYITEVQAHEICRKLQEGFSTRDILLICDFLSPNERDRDVVRKIKVRKTWKHVSVFYTF